MFAPFVIGADIRHSLSGCIDTLNVNQMVPPVKRRQSVGAPFLLLQRLNVGREAENGVTSLTVDSRVLAAHYYRAAQRTEACNEKLAGGGAPV